MTGWAIVAIPSENDPVWQYSSEKVPHMTLLYLGEQTGNLDEKQTIEFVSHVTKTSLRPFYMEVEHRGLLGSKNADVLFFKKSQRNSFSMIDNARAYLLTDPQILKAYSSADQYPEWTPHLTMGFPETPAKKDDREYSGFRNVEFDRIALWTGDYSGIEFKLEYNDEDMGLAEVAMSDQIESFLQHLGIITDGMTMNETEKDTDAFLEHYGVKGMKWGRRKAPNTNQEEIRENKSRKKTSPLAVKQKLYDRANADTAVTVTLRPGQKVATKGGSNYPASEDAIKAAVAKRVVKSSTTDALSNKELQTLVNRMNLEQQYSKLSNPNNAQVKNGQSVVKKLLGIKSDVDKLANDPFVKRAASDIASEFIKRKGQGSSPGTELALR